MRWYIPLPFQWLWYNYIINLLVIGDDYDDIHTPLDGELWSILVGKAQYKMKWYYDSEEVFKSIREKLKK